MSTLTVTTNYADAAVLTETQLDAANASIETFMNTTKVSDDNIQAASLDGSEIQSGTITTAKLQANAITAALIVDGAISAAKIYDSNVTTAKIADNAVTTAKIATDGVTTAKIADSAVTTSKIADNAVTTAKIADGTVAAVDISSYSVLQSMKAALNYSKSASTTTSTTSTSYTSVTNTSAITTNGNPVYVFGESASTNGCIKIYDSSISSGYYGVRGWFRLKRGTTVLTEWEFAFHDYDGRPGAAAGSQIGLYLPCGSIAYLDQPTAGSHTYYLEFKQDGTSGTYESATIAVDSFKLVAMELK